MNKKTIVSIKFKQKGDVRKVKLEALHNGVYQIDKQSLSSNDPLELYKFTQDFIEKHDATNISMKRGIMEDAFAAYLKSVEQTEETKQDQSNIIEGVQLKSLKEENRELLLDLKIYKQCLLDAIEQKDYKSMLLQGILYETARQELTANENVLVDPFKLTVQIPNEEKIDVEKAVIYIRDMEMLHGNEPLELKKYNRIFEITKTNYKLTIEFV